MASSPSVDDDADGLTNTQEAWWCTDPLDTDTDDDGRTDGAEILALENWIVNKSASVPGETPWPSWPFNTTTCPDKDHDSIPNLAERWALGLNMDWESSDRDKFDDGQELFGVTYCPGGDLSCNYGALPRSSDSGYVGATVPSWVQAPGKHPLVAAFPIPEVDVVESSLKVQTVTTVTTDHTIGSGIEKSYSTAKTQGTSTSVGNTEIWNNWQEVSRTTPDPSSAVVSSYAQSADNWNFWEAKETANEFLEAACSVPQAPTNFQYLDFAIQLGCLAHGVGGLINEGIYLAAFYGPPVVASVSQDIDTLQTLAGQGIHILGQHAAAGYDYIRNMVERLAATGVTLVWPSGGSGQILNVDNSGQVTLRPSFQIESATQHPTTTQSYGKSWGGSRTTTHSQYEEHTITNGEAFSSEESWGTATAVDSAHSADLWFTYKVRNTGTEYAREIADLLLNVYIGDDPNPVYTYFVGPDLGGDGKFHNFMPGEEHTYTSRHIPLTLEQTKDVDLGGPIRIVVEDFTYGTDEQYYQDAANAGVLLAMEDGTDDGDEAIDTYLIPTWGTETVLDVLARYFPHETDSDGLLTAISTPEYRSDVPVWCIEPNVVGAGSQTTIWCKHALSTADWWNIYTDGMGDGSEGFQDTLASPGQVALFRFNKDTDLDGYSDRSEAGLGTDPDDPASYPKPELLAGVHSIRSGNNVVATLSLLNTGLYDAYGVEAVMIAPDDSISITNNTVGGSGRVRAQKQVIVGSRITAQTPLPPAWLVAGHGQPTVGGYYVGTSDRVYTFTAADNGSVGGGTLRLNWSDSGGGSGTLNFGAGYLSPTLLDVSSGMKLGLLTGTLVAGESFTVTATTPRDTFQYTIAAGHETNFTPPVVLVSYNDPQGNHRFAIPPAALSLGSPSTDLVPFAGQMLQEPGVEIVTSMAFTAGANTTELVVNNPTETALTDAHLFLEFIDPEGNVVSEVPTAVNLPAGPSVVPVAWDSASFSPAYDPAMDYIVMAFWTDYQGNILDTAGRPLSSFQEDPKPELAMASEDATWDFGTAAQGTILKRSFSFANTGFGDLQTYVSAPAGLSVSQTGSRSLSPADMTTYEMTVNTASLAVGPYDGTITIRSSDPAQPTKTVHVTGTVTAGTPDTQPGAMVLPLDWPASVSGNIDDWVNFAHTLGPEPQTLHPVKVYSQDYAKKWGVGKYATAFSAGTASYEMFGDGRDLARTIAANTTDSPIDSACSGSAGSYTLSATNAGFAVVGQAVMIHQTQGAGAGTWMLNKIAGYSAGTITLQKSLNATYSTGAQVLVVKQYTDVTVNSGVSWTAKAWNGTTGGVLAFLANGTVTVSGAIVANSAGFRSGAGGGDTHGGGGGEGIYGWSGRGAGLNEAPMSPGGGGGAGGDTTNSGASSGLNSGGAGGGYAKGTDASEDEGAGAGGGGGHVYGGGGGGGGEDSHRLGGAGGLSNAALGGGGGGGYHSAGGASGQPGGGSGGAAGGAGYTGGGGNGSTTSEQGSAGGGGGGNYGIADLSRIFFGSGGGGGGGVDKRDNGGKNGGNGAGIVLIAGQKVNLLSSVAVSANGAAGITSAANDHGGSGGGGAGGSVLLRAGQASLGSLRMTALGGNGGSPSNPGGGGGQGSPGRIRVEYCDTPPTFSTTPAASTQKLNCYLAEQVESSPYTTTRLNLPETGTHTYQVQYGRKLNYTGAANQVATLRVPAGMFNSLTLQALVSDMPSNGNLIVDVGNDGVDVWSLPVSNAGEPTSANLAASFNSYWATHGRPTTGTIDVPVRVNLDRAGQVLLTNIQTTLTGSKTRYVRLPVRPQGYSSVAASFTVSGGSVPLAVGVDVGANGSVDWTYTGSPAYPASLTTGDLATAINAYLSGKSGEVDVPIRFCLAPFATLNLTGFTATPAGQPDAVISASDIAFGTTDPVEGDEVIITAIAHNSGQLDTGPVTASFFATSPDWGEWYVGSAFVPNVPAGGTAQAQITWNTLGFTGDTPVRVSIDPYNRLAETDEANNEAIKSLTIKTRPDLHVTDITPSDDEPMAGETVDVTLTLRNEGQTTAVTAVLALYDGNPDAGGTLIGESSTGVAPASETTVSFAWTPGAASAHKLFARADRDRQVREYDEGNNDTWQDLYVGFASPILIDSGGGDAYDPAYAASLGFGYLNGDLNTFCGAGSNGSQRNDWSGQVQYRFDNLLPGHFYHLDLTLYECDGLGRQEQVRIDDNLISDAIDLGDLAPHRLSFRLDPALYADRSIVVSIEELLGNDAVVSEINLYDIDYRYADAGGSAEADYSAARTFGPLDGVKQTTWGTLPYQSRRIDLGDSNPADDPDNELRYRYDGLDPNKYYQLLITVYQGSGTATVQQTVAVDSVDTGVTLEISGIDRDDRVIDVPVGMYSGDGTITVRVTRLNATAGAFINEIALEELTLLPDVVTEVTQAIDLHTGGPNWFSFNVKPPVRPPAACTGVTATSAFTSLYGDALLGELAVPVGTIVEAYTPGGVKTGCFKTTTAGLYGYMRVYGAEGATAGMQSGDPIILKINGIAASPTPYPVVWHDDKATHEIDLAAPDVIPVESLLAPIEGKVTKLQCENGTYLPPPADPRFNTCTTVAPGRGYLLWMNTVASLGITGNRVAADKPIELHAGYNWLGQLPTCELTVATALAGIAGKYDILHSEAGTYKPPPADPAFNTFNTMAPGRGYMIHMTQAAALTYPADLCGTAMNAVEPANAPALTCPATPTGQFTHFYGQVQAPAGAPVIATSPREEIVGCGQVGEDGLLPYLRVYGAEGATPGMNAGESVRFTVTGQPLAVQVFWRNDWDVHLLGTEPASGRLFLPVIAR